MESDQEISLIRVSETKDYSPTLKEVLWEAARNAICLKLPHSFREYHKYDSDCSINITTAFGVMLYAAILILVGCIDYKNISNHLPIKFNISDDTNIWYRIFIPIGILIYHYLSEMGNAKSQIEQRRKYDDERLQALQERERAHQERERAHQERERAQIFRDYTKSMLDLSHEFHLQGQSAFQQAQEERSSMKQFRNAIGEYCLTLAEHQVEISRD